MNIITLFLVLFFFLGVLIAPLGLAFATRMFSVDRGRALGRWTFTLGLKSYYRPSITFNSADELAMKRRSYDEKHNAEYIAFGGLLNRVKRYLHDPQDRIHGFYGVPFGLVDELFGLVVDPRDIVVARELRHHQQNDVYEHQVERDGKLHEAVRAVFELPRASIGVRLSDVDTLVGGSFDSQVVDRIREIYQKSQAPRMSNAPLLKLLVPVMAFAAVVILGMFISGQGAAGGAAPSPSPTGNTTDLTVGSVLILLFSLADPRAINWRDVFAGLAFVGVGLGFAAMMYVAMPVPYTMLLVTLPLGLWAIVMFAIGAVVPFFVASILGRSLGPIGILLGKIFVIIGLLPFEKPVIDFDGRGYSLAEYDGLEWAVEPKWYRFAMTRIGIGMQNDPETWPRGTTLEPPKVRAMADGGVDDDLAAPTGHTATELIAVQDINGFVPDNPDEHSVFVRTDRTTGWMLEAGQARRLMTAALQNAKEEFGGGREQVSDKWLFAGVLAGMVGGAIFDVVVFF